MSDLKIDENLKISDEHTRVPVAQTIVNDVAYQNENNCRVHNFSVPGFSMMHPISPLCYNETNAYAENALYNIVSTLGNHSITFTDIVGFVAPFEGAEHENIDSWLHNFKDTATVLCLLDIKKLLFAKRLLTSKAKLFISSEPNVYPFTKLKNLLLSEFSIDTNSADLHDMLLKKKMKPDETLYNYYLQKDC